MLIASETDCASQQPQLARAWEVGVMMHGAVLKRCGSRAQPHSGTAGSRLLYSGSDWRGVSLALPASSRGPEVLPAEALLLPAEHRV